MKSETNCPSVANNSRLHHNFAQLEAGLVRRGEGHGEESRRTVETRSAS